MDDAGRKLLEAAGYVWLQEDGLWMHRTSRRTLDGAIAGRMTIEQLRRWIQAGQPSP